MNIRSFTNTNNETASTDGTRWWLGKDADEASIALARLQPVSALFPPLGDTEDGQAVLAQKARAVFIAALRRQQPTVTPADDAERAVLRKAWDDAERFERTHKVLAVARPVFRQKFMCIGTADVIFAGAAARPTTYCYAPDGYEWGGETNVVVRLLCYGFPIACADDLDGCYTLRNVARAITALLYRDCTPWYMAHMKELPF